MTDASCMYCFLVLSAPEEIISGSTTGDKSLRLVFPLVRAIGDVFALNGTTLYIEIRSARVEN